MAQGPSSTSLHAEGPKRKRRHERNGDGLVSSKRQRKLDEIELAVTGSLLSTSKATDHEVALADKRARRKAARREKKAKARALAKADELAIVPQRVDKAYTSEAGQSDLAQLTDNKITNEHRSKQTDADLEQPTSSDGRASQELQVAQPTNPQPVQQDQDSERPAPSKTLKQQWILSTRKGGRFADQDPVFFYRGRREHLVTAQGDAMQVLSVDDSVIVATLEPRSGARIVSFHAVNTAGEDLVRVLYSDNVVIDWAWYDDTEEESRVASDNINIYRLASLDERIASIYTTRLGNQCRLLLDGITLHEFRGSVIDIRILTGVKLIVLLCKRSLIIGRRRTDAKYTWLELDLLGDAICFDVRTIIAAKNQESAEGVHIAVGFSDGKIHSYTDIMDLFLAKASRQLTPRILHWHRNAVASVKFSPDGSYLISGGLETVLVLWQLETGNKSFLPNLTAAIERIVVNPVGNRYAIQLGDNSIMVLSTSELKPVAFISGLQIAVELDAQVTRLAALLHPVRRDELLVTVPASQPHTARDLVARPFLQSCDPMAGTYSTRQALARNNVTDFNTSPENAPILPPDVGLIAISPNGQWLATVDEWTPPTQDIEHVDDEIDTVLERQEVYLKFWQWHDATAQWRLNSRIDGPHCKGDSLAGAISGSVLSLISLPKRNGFATIGQDGQVKLWSPRRRTRYGEAILDDSGKQEIKWVGRTLAILDQSLDDGETQALEGVLAASDDGSIIATALREVSTATETIYFIDTGTGTLRIGNSNIAAPGLLDLAFADRYLIALSTRSIRVWDVVEDFLQWSASVPNADDDSLDQTPLLAVNKLDNVFVVASSDPSGAASMLSVFQLQPPSLIHHITTKQRVAAILAAPNDRGFLIVYDDATTSTFRSSLSLSMRSLTQLEPSAAEGHKIVAPSSRRALTAPREATRSTGAPDVPFAFDDRPVVRLEEMAAIFDNGPNGAALPSIKDMFHAVAGLFGRRPRPKTEAA